MVVTTLWKTVRVRLRNEASLREWRTLGPGPILFALWHGDHFPIACYYRHSGTFVIVSRSGDGEILARLLEGLGYRTVRGSTSRGAVQATIDLARKVNEGADAAVAVDGPRGPAFEVKPGIVLLAKMTRCPIVPLAAAMSHAKQFRSWDRFRLPYPGSRVLMMPGEPFLVPPHASVEQMEAIRGQLESAMTALWRDAQQLVQGREFARSPRPLGPAASKLKPS